jgi:hypothetical protein
MTETVAVNREPSFKELLRRANNYQKQAREAQAHLDASVEKLREVCPHLAIAVAPSSFGSRRLRVCQHCGIQEVDWESSFTTLTAPGGTWYGTNLDKSRERRKGQHPTLFPMSSDQAYSYRRGPHKDVTVG